MRPHPCPFCSLVYPKHRAQGLAVCRLSVNICWMNERFSITICLLCPVCPTWSWTKSFCSLNEITLRSRNRSWSHWACVQSGVRKKPWAWVPALPCSSLVFQGSLFHILSLHFLTWREKNPQPSQSCWGSIKKRKKVWKWRAFKMIRVLLFINWKIFLWEVTDRRVNLWRKIINNIINDKYYNK